MKVSVLAMIIERLESRSSVRLDYLTEMTALVWRACEKKRIEASYYGDSHNNIAIEHTAINQGTQA